MKLTSAILVTLLTATSALAAPTTVVERSTSGTTDDGETGIRAFIAYDGNWTHLKNQGKQLYQGTESYTHDANGSYRFYTFGAKSIKIYAAKKADRGKFDVSLDGVHIGTGDAYGPCTGNECKSQLVFSYDNLPNDVNKRDVTVSNKASDSRLKGKVPYLAVDKIDYTIA